MTGVSSEALAQLSENERRLAMGNDFWNSCEPEAHQELMELLLSGDCAIAGPNLAVTLGILYGDFIAALGQDLSAFNKAISNGPGRDDAELGRIVRAAAERCAAAYCASPAGKKWIADRVSALWQQRRGSGNE